MEQNGQASQHGLNDGTKSQPSQEQEQEPGRAAANDPSPQEPQPLKGMARIRVEIARDEDKRRQYLLRLEKMEPEERATYLESRGRNRYAERRRAARRADTVEIALTSYLTEDQCADLLRQPYYPPDGTTFLRSLNGYLNDMGDIRDFRRVLGENTGNPKCFMLRSAELCKFALVDWRVPRQEHIRELGPSLALDRLYEAHVQELRQDDRLAQAREVARGHPQQYNLRLTQYWARRMLHEYEGAVEREEPLTDQTAPAVWANIVPKAPAWIAEIRRWGQDFGFVCYRSSEAERRPAVARDRWFSIFEDTDAPDCYDGSPNEFCGYRRGADMTIMRGYDLGEYMNALWQPSCAVHGLPSEACPSAFREHFKTIAKPNLDSPRMSRNTFLVLHNDCLFPDLDTHGVELGEPLFPSAGAHAEDGAALLTTYDLPHFFLWAYDANWEPPSRSEGQVATTVQVEGCNCQGTVARGYGGADEDGYQGRVKVRVHSLFTWLYYARHVRDQVIDLKDIWRIAQDMPNQVWNCGTDRYDKSHPNALP
ncbi:hypothetical protein NCS57_00508700 [Fusarium keratoplasticum]|uniref:Uncharacterized protein n=1 Tax=Fusarium keratoplasticum TaxID=1328300 RepID=A0ACC0R8P1_9HYPO|nr:hypothetical protein NCS57_00508700 [Fusarium keratoplasticum]KAI8676054.1 hypothetical protein NCS57_00508700 [Fusarium keratoplasticum]